MGHPRGRKSEEDSAYCAPGAEKPPPERKSRLIGTICALEAVRGRGERELARIAGIQHGCAHRRQLLDAGLGAGAIKHRLKTHRYLLLHSAVYLIDAAKADQWTATAAAVLMYAGDAVVSGRSAGALWQILDEMPPRPELTLVGRSANATTAARLRRIALLDRRDVTWRNGLPVASVPRTIVDLAAVLTPLELENAIATALRLRLTTVPKIREAMHRAPHSRGIAALRHLLDRGGFARTRSHYERKLLQMLTAAGLPRPLTNHRIQGHEVDMCWPDQKLVVEFDGYAFHNDRSAFENDRRRDQDLVAAGYRVIRITARQVDEEPLALIARLTAALMA